MEYLLQIDIFVLKKAEEEDLKCQRSFEDFQRDARVKTDVKFLGDTAFFIKGLKEERRCKTEGRSKKEEMVGFEPPNGPV